MAILPGQTRYAKLQPDGEGFRERYQKFRETLESEELEICPEDVFAEPRSKTPGRFFAGELSVPPRHEHGLLDTNTVSETMRTGVASIGLVNTP